MGSREWEANKEILQRHYAGLLEELAKEDGHILAEEDIKIENAPSGDVSLCVRGIYVHSQRDPAREGKRLADAALAENGSDKSPVVILGFGLGYAAQAAAETGRTVIITEKYKSLLLKAFELRDFSEFLLKSKIIFIIGGAGEGITGALDIANKLAGIEETDEKGRPVVIRNKALTGLDEEWYRLVEDRIRTWTIKDNVNDATHTRFGERWVRNLSRNMSAIRDCPGVSCFAGIASDSKKSSHGGTGARGEEGCLPVFLGAAGPGLDKVKGVLHEIYERCIIVAVDTSLRFFTDNGVEPDFVLVVDPQYWNSRHLDRCVCKKTALIAESAVFPPVLHLPFKNIFLCGSLFPLGSFIENQVDPKGLLGAGGSVATTAWDFARTLGGSGIWIAGLDLSFPGLKTHFHGARFEERAVSEACRFNPVETWLVRALRDGLPFKAPSASGAQVLTDRRLSLYASWFENRFRNYPEVKNYSLSCDGIAIAGMESADMQTLLSLPARRGEINSRLDEVYLQIEKSFYSPQSAQQRAERYEKAVSVLTRGLKSIKKAAEEGADIAQKSLERKLNPEQQNKVIKDLDYVTRRIAESEVKEVAGFLLPGVENEKDPDSFRAYLKTSYKLFSTLAKTVTFNLDNIN